MGLEFKLAPWQAAAIYGPYTHTALFGGVATGKSYTGGHFSIHHFAKMPHLTGFVGANSYDQLNQSTLRELFTLLDHHRLPYVYNCRPPRKWAQDQSFPSYKNVVSVKIGSHTAHAFTRVLSDPDALRGIQFSWYHLDETRDTPHNAHDIILSRMRESRYVRGLITSTTNGEDWGYNRFAKARVGQHLYGSIHVRTLESVKLGIITKEYYDALMQSYSELMIAQELDALHVNVFGGRAYYAGSGDNAKVMAPWGTRFPQQRFPLIVGCDFNFDPAPHIWMIGQISPDGQSIHWFSEVSGARKSTVEMTQMLINRFPGFHYRVYGDRSGARATTSNAGKPDYDQMAIVFQDNGCSYTMDTDQGNNPLVRNRVENMNRMFKDGTGNVRQTYNPHTCPHFDSDVKLVGWKTNVMRGQGKLDNGGNLKLTHATDGAGYAVWKLFPFIRRATLIPGIASIASETQHY